MSDAAGERAVLQADGISLQFGAVHALRSVSLCIEEGEIHAVIGPNGAGKSSLLNCLSGFYRPQAGTVRFRRRGHLGSRAAQARRARYRPYVPGHPDLSDDDRARKHPDRIP